MNHYFYADKKPLYYFIQYIASNLKPNIMGTYKKIHTINLARFSNAEYLSYLNGIVAFFPVGEPEEWNKDDRPVIESLIDENILVDGSPAIGLSPEFVQKLEKNLLLLADVVNESRISQETEEAVLHETNRDNLVIYITTRISRAGTLPLEAERDAGKFLYKVIKPYISITRLPVAQESAAIQGLLIDLRKEENKEYVTTLGLDAYLAELEKENNAYIALTLARTQSRAANKKESGTEIRKRLDEQYDDMVMLAQSFSVVRPSAKATTFINNLNQLIAETVTAYNQRGKAPRKKSEEEDDRPLIP